MEAQRLPLEESALEELHQRVSAEALQRFDKDKFGSETGASVGKLR